VDGSVRTACPEHLAFHGAILHALVEPDLNGRSFQAENGFQVVDRFPLRPRCLARIGCGECGKPIRRT
jgi:hypothetical protein